MYSTFTPSVYPCACVKQKATVSPSLNLLTTPHPRNIFILCHYSIPIPSSSKPRRVCVQGPPRNLVLWATNPATHSHNPYWMPSSIHCKTKHIIRSPISRWDPFLPRCVCGAITRPKQPGARRKSMPLNNIPLFYKPTCHRTCNISSALKITVLQNHPMNKPSLPR